jgi:hypothetical protein
MRHLLIGAALVLGALLLTATIAGYLESAAVRPEATNYTPPSAPSPGRATGPEQGRSLLNVVWRRMSQ